MAKLVGPRSGTASIASRRQSKDLTAKSMAKLVGPRSGTAWAGVSKLAAQAPGLDLHT